MTFNTIAELIAYINETIVPNGANEITGEEHNNVENGLAYFIVKSILNNDRATIVSGGGVVVLPAPFTVISGAVPTSISWTDNIYNEYYIVNATGSSVPIANGYSFYDTYGTQQTTIPARSIVQIVKAKNNNWFQANTIVGASSDGLPPQTGHAGEILFTDGTNAYWDDVASTIPAGPITSLPTVGFNPGTNLTANQWITAVFYRLAISVQPQSQSVSSGASVSFSVTAIGGTTPYTYQWKRNGTDITGATNSTYNIGSVSGSNTGNYTVVITDAATATVTSNTAVLSIASVGSTFKIGYSTTDPFVNTSTVPSITYDQTITYTTGADLVATINSNYANKYIAWEFDATEPTPTTYYNTALNQGAIPSDGIIRAIFTVGSKKYAVSRDPLVLDVSQTLELRH